jgi:hypothetical protein
MALVRLIDALRTRPRLTAGLALAGLALLVLWDALLLDKHKAHSAMENLPGWWSLFGLAGCAVLIIFSKWLVGRIVTTGEDYYE